VHDGGDGDGGGGGAIGYHHRSKLLYNLIDIFVQAL